MFNSVVVHNYRSIDDSGELPLDRITLIVGRNNTGKSALLRAIYLTQEGSLWQKEDIRIGREEMSVALGYKEVPLQVVSSTGGPIQSGPGHLMVVRNLSGGLKNVIKPDGLDAQEFTIQSIPGQEPNNLIVPVLSGRRVSYYREQASRDGAINISPQDSYLVSRVLRLASSSIPEAVKFRYLCRNVLGINFDVFASDSGQQLGVQVDLHNSIALEAMGAGLSGTLGLLVGLSTSHGKLFIIEEPEDALHPQALKDLLDAIAQASADNQFIISTHSSIVLTRLGGVDHSVLISVENDHERVPKSTYRQVSGRAARLDVLRDLGYSLADLDLGQGWIIFEESSAERIIRQYFIRWYAPKLQNLRTVAARGTSRVSALFGNFREMFIYAHLEPFYRNRAWVIVDGDEAGLQVTQKLKDDFRDWPEECFINWKKGKFEDYYPSEFHEEVVEVFEIRDKNERQNAKQELLKQLIAWMDKDEDRARESFLRSAGEVIRVLQAIEKQLEIMEVAG